MTVTMNDLSPKARSFAQYCIDNCSLKDLADMVYTEKKIEQCAWFGITEQQWNNAVYVVIKQMGQNYAGEEAIANQGD